MANIEKAVAKTLNVWISGVGLALNEFAALDHLPHRVLLCGGGSSLQMLVDKLEDSDWHRSLAFTRKPIVQYIKPDEVAGIIDTTGEVNDHTFVTVMGLLRVGMDTLNTSGGDEPASIRDKLNKILRT